MAYIEPRSAYSVNTPSNVFPVAVWSGVNVAGTHLLDVSPLAGQEEDPEHWEQIHKDVVNRSVREQLIIKVSEGAS